MFRIMTGGSKKKREGDVEEPKTASNPEFDEVLIKPSRFNFYKEHKERKQREKLEQAPSCGVVSSSLSIRRFGRTRVTLCLCCAQIKCDSKLQERLAQETERDQMESEEKLSWDAHAFPAKNYARFVWREKSCFRSIEKARESERERERV